MKTYQGTHGVHILEYQSKINKLLCYLTNRYPRLIAVRVDLHYPDLIIGTIAGGIVLNGARRILALKG